MSTEDQKNVRHTHRQSDRVPVIGRKDADLWTKEELAERWQIIQHDTRSVISAAFTTISAIKKALERDTLTPEKLLKYTDILTRSLERIQHLLLDNNLDEKYRLRIEEVNLLELFEETGQQFHTESGGRLEITLDRSLNCIIEADRFLLADIFTNLVLNTHEALDNIPSGTLQISAQHSGEQINILLRDNGPGIALSIREQLFLRGTSTKENTATHGTGLFGAQRNARLHSGSLKLISTITKEELEINPSETQTGATFMLSLPMRQTIEEEQQEEKKLA